MHYMLPALRRLPEVQELVEQKKYFILHAPRQVGKTTALTAYARALTDAGRFSAVLLSMETGAQFSTDVGAAEAAILDDWQRDIRHQLPRELQPPPFPAASPGARIGAALERWAEWSPRPLVVFLDEIDALHGSALAGMLRQLRSGYMGRPRGFPHSVALAGSRALKDLCCDELDVGGLFNVSARTLRLRNFMATEVAELFAQHSVETGQTFAGDATLQAFSLSQGDPWLVNVLAAISVEELVRDRSVEITAAHVDKARDVLIGRRGVVLGHLMAPLGEPRVRAVVEPILVGAPLVEVSPEEVRRTIDLGLMRVHSAGRLEVSCPIVGEVLVKELAPRPRESGGREVVIHA